MNAVSTSQYTPYSNRSTSCETQTKIFAHTLRQTAPEAKEAAEYTSTCKTWFYIKNNVI